MVTIETWSLLVPILIAICMAVNMGGSGTAPAFAAAYGADMIRKELIPVLFGFFVLLGAVLAGQKVMATVGGQVLDGSLITASVASVVLASVTVSLLCANLLGVPQSTSQSTVFALVGAAAYLGGLNVEKVAFEIVPLWFVLPVVGFVIVLVVSQLVWAPLHRIGSVRFQELGRHRVLRAVVIAASCYVAFAIGSNNVANAAGPLVSMVTNELALGSDPRSTGMVMVMCALIITPNFGIGSALLGPKVMRTAGKEIVGFGPLAAVLISVTTASLLLGASLTKGIPVSLVQLNIGAIVALSICRVGWRETLQRVALRKILVVWLVAPLLALALSYLLLLLLDKAGWL